MNNDIRIMNTTTIIAAIAARKTVKKARKTVIATGVAAISARIAVIRKRIFTWTYSCSPR